MADFLSTLEKTPEAHRVPRRTADLGKRDFDSYVERSQGEEFYTQAERLTSVLLSSIDSAIYDQAEEGSIEERIARNTDQFIAALQATVQTVFAGESSAGGAVEKGRSGVRSTMATNRRADVVGEATRIAQEKLTKGEAGSMAAARARVWRERPDLAKRYVELPVEQPAATVASAPVVKGADALTKIDAEATRLGVSRSEVTRRRPDLRDEYHQAFAR